MSNGFSECEIRKKMKIEVGGRFLFKATNKECPSCIGCSNEFGTAFPYWGDLSGKEVKILRMDTESPFQITLYAVDYGPTYWVNAVPGKWIQQGLIGRRCWENFLQPLEDIQQVVCQCNIWVTGCKCGVFKAEQTGK